MGYTESFDASVHYDDWKGTAAADNSDHLRITEYLRNQNLMSDDEFLLSISFGVIQGHNHIRAFIYQGGPDIQGVNELIAAMTDPVPVREVRLDMTSDEFLNLFKMFQVKLQYKELDLEGKELETQDD